MSSLVGRGWAIVESRRQELARVADGGAGGDYEQRGMTKRGQRRVAVGAGRKWRSRVGEVAGGCGQRSTGHSAIGGM